MPPSWRPALRLLPSGQALRAGGTSVREYPELARHFGLPTLWVKDESENPFGTHKDRKSEYVITHLRASPRASRPDAVCIFTSGNAGLSLAGFAAPAGIPVIAILDESRVAPTLLTSLRSACQRVVPIDAGGRHWSEEDLRLVAGEDRGARVFDATSRAEAYAGLVDELAPDRPDVLVVPVGTGELFVGVYSRLQALGWSTRLVGVTVSRSDSIADKLYALWTPYHARIKKLCSPPSRHRIVSLQSENSLESMWRFASRYLACEPSSAAAFEALRLMSFGRQERIVVVNTGGGRGIDIGPTRSVTQ